MVKYDKAIDVSWHQGDIDWEKVQNTGVKHAIIKATEGFTLQDNKFYIIGHKREQPAFSLKLTIILKQYQAPLRNKERILARS